MVAATKLPIAPQSTTRVYQCNICTEKYPIVQHFCNNCWEKKGIRNELFTTRDVYCLDKILSYNAFMNLIVGGRRGGKTYACATYCINRWEQFKEKFAWIRRYKTEEENALKAFVKLGYKFDKKGVYIETDEPTGEEDFEDTSDKKKKRKTKNKLNKLYIGLFFSVSTASRIRGGEFGDFTTMVWDEYGDEAGTEFKKEFLLFNSIVVSLFDEKENCKVFVLSNNVNRFLPIYQHAEVRWDQEWSYNWQKDVVTHVWKRDFEFIGSASKWLQSTDYYNYAVHNKPLDYDAQLIEKYMLEFAENIFCFKLGLIKQNLRLVEYPDGYAIDYCERCRHPCAIIDTVNAIRHVQTKEQSKQIHLLNLYMGKKLKYSTPEIKQEITFWVSHHLYLI